MSCDESPTKRRLEERESGEGEGAFLSSKARYRRETNFLRKLGVFSNNRRAYLPRVLSVIRFLRVGTFSLTGAINVDAVGVRVSVPRNVEISLLRKSTDNTRYFNQIIRRSCYFPDAFGATKRWRIIKCTERQIATGAKGRAENFHTKGTVNEIMKQLSFRIRYFFRIRNERILWKTCSLTVVSAKQPTWEKFEQNIYGCTWIRWCPYTRLRYFI